jgi:hypothetical protein
MGLGPWVFVAKRFDYGLGLGNDLGRFLGFYYSLRVLC